MSQLGERLRAVRESQGISMAQAAAETRILQRYLVALEDGDFHHLPGDVYARGFIRNYASYLGIPAEELIELYRHERGTTDPIRVVPATSAPRIRGLFVPSFFGVFFIVLAFIGITYLVLTLTNQVGESRGEVATLPTPFATPLNPSAPPLGSDLPPTSVATGVVPAPTAIDQAGVAPTAAVPTPTVELDAPIVFEVRIQEGDNPGSWLSIEADGKQVLQRILGPGQTFRAQAQRRVTMKAGNAGVVYLTVNGQPQGSGALGGPGEVVTVTWPPQ